MQGCTEWPMLDFVKGGLIILEEIKNGLICPGCTKWPMVDFVKTGLILLD